MAAAVPSVPSTAVVEFRKNAVVHIVEGLHAGQQGTFVKHNGGANNDQCAVRVEERGVVRTVYVRVAVLRHGRAPVLGPAPPAPATTPTTQADVDWCTQMLRKPAPADARASKPDDSGYVYIFSNPSEPGQLKVGRAREVEKRLRAARVYVSAMRCMASFWCADYVRGERLAHSLLAEYRARAYGGPGNEWFEVSLLRASVACARAAQLS
jgi:hypothetical protein